MADINNLPDLEFDDDEQPAQAALPDLEFDDEDERADLPVDLDAAPDNNIGYGETALRGAAQMASGGLIDEATAAIGAAKDSIGSESVDFGQAYKAWTDILDRKDKAAAEANPKVDTAAKIAGGVMSMGALGAASKAAQGVGTVGKGLNAANKTLNPALGALNKAKTWTDMGAAGIAGGGLYGFGSSDAHPLADQGGDGVLDEAGLKLKALNKLLGDTNEGATVGLATSPAAVLGGKGIERAMELPAKLGARLMGRSFDDSTAYLANREQINNPELTFKNIQQQIDDHARGVYGQADDVARQSEDTIAAGKESLASGKEALKTSESTIKDAYDRAGMAAKGHKSDVSAAEQAVLDAEKANTGASRGAEREYNTALKAGESKFAADAKSTYVPDEAVDEIKQALKVLNKQMRGAAEGQRATLPTGTKVPMKDMHDYITTQLEARRVNGEFDLLDADAKFLQLMQRRLERKVEVPGEAEAKTVVPEMSPDEVLTHRQNTRGGGLDAKTGTRLPKSDRFVREYRTMLNGKLDSLTPGIEHSEARALLSRKISALDDASGRFGGNSAQVRRALSRLEDPKYQDTAKALERLEQETGKDVRSKMAAYLEAKRLGADPDELRAAYMKTNPAATEREAMEQLRTTGADEVTALRGKADTTRKSADEATRFAENDADDLWESQLTQQDLIRKGMSEAEAKIVAAKTSADAAHQRASIVRPVAPKGSMKREGSQGTLNRLLTRKDTKPEMVLSESMSRVADDMGNPGLMKDIENLATKQRFSGGGPHGSRLASMGGDFASMFGLPRAVGSIPAGMLDFGASKVAKAGLDAAALSGQLAPAAVRGATNELSTEDLIAYLRAKGLIPPEGGAK